MHCPTCGKNIAWDWLEEQSIEPNETFHCPHCGEPLRYELEEDPSLGEQHIMIKAVND